MYATVCSLQRGSGLILMPSLSFTPFPKWLMKLKGNTAQVHHVAMKIKPFYALSSLLSQIYLAGSTKDKVHIK